MPSPLLLSRILAGVMSLLLVLLPPASAFAQDDSEVRAYLLSVDRLYEDLEYESALNQITRARAVARTPGHLVALALYEGVILADMNRWEASAAAFKKALELQPEAKLPVKEVSPKVAQHLERVRQSVKQELAAKQKPPEPPRPAPPPLDKPLKDSKPEAVVSNPLPAPKPALPAVPSEPSSTVTSEAPQASSRSFMRPQILGPAIGGGVLLVLGGTSWAMSRKELSRLNGDHSALATPEDVQQASSRGRTFQSVGVGLMGAGVAGLGFALGWYAFGPPSNEAALSVGTNGTSAFVQGRWP
jgi:outer membrane biosynthesis protein TonB